ncbi:MAG: copper resistance protein NlpE N-terminal domain-containing protein [Woeseiaceae bacterium]|nr:copper resistance protein NlpE N-terminal domain-containing protein [Woeseiaceae bacterium]
MRVFRSLILGITVLVAACSEDRAAREAEIEAALPGVYAGTFPCQNCPGIEVTVWMRPDRRFFIRREYLADADSPASTVYNLGRWTLLAGGEAVELRGAGPVRSFDRRDNDTLLMQTGSEVEHRLTRQRQSPAFTQKIALSGMMSMQGDRASFAECYTGFRTSVAKNGDFASFGRQYRNAAKPGEAAFVEFEGRFLWSGDGSLRAVTIDDFRTIKDGRRC